MYQGIKKGIKKKADTWMNWVEHEPGQTTVMQ